MGKSKTIEQKMQEDKKFREYMDQLGQEARKEEERILVDIRNTVSSHYEENKWDHARLFGDKKSDFQNYDDWSLSRVNSIVDSIGNALSSGDYPSKNVPGSEDADKSTVDKAKEFTGAFAGDYSLIIARVKTLISGVLSQFATASKATRKSSFNDIPLSGGLHLFFGSTGEVFTQNTFFTNQFIGSFQIVFEVYMSVDEAKAIGIQQILQTTEFELNLVKEQIIDVRIQAKKSLQKILEQEPEKYVATKATYDLIIESLKADRAELMLEYDKYNQVTNAVDSFMSNSLLLGTSSDLEVNLKTIFNDWEVDLAKRYIAEKYQTANAY
ncbi:hypothetical protein [Sphingobacterium suaedae]|mgnify:CR=1 FL=1|uniref:Uncharacterized protein n=1 Tax=Sphingobacterium suaedae TaxID=1686402 RepID=A0ABW5KM42_9SPHI